MSKKLAEQITKKKTVHIEIPRAIHTKMRIVLLENGELPIQAVFREVAERITLEDPYMIRLMKAVQEKRENQRVRTLGETDAESLFNILERESPLSSKE